MKINQRAERGTAAFEALANDARGLESGFFGSYVSDGIVVEELAPLGDDAVSVTDDGESIALYTDAIVTVVTERYGDHAVEQTLTALSNVSDVTGRAWLRVLRGETSDLRDASALLLDEWTALFIAKLFGDEANLLSIRRALRDRGVCAFGLVGV